MKQYIVECIGTFFLMLTVIFSGEPWAIGLLFAAMLYIGHTLTRGYYNPAVAATRLFHKTITMPQFLGCCIAQILGATLAATYFFLVSGDYFILELPAGIMFADVALREMLFTFVLCSVTLAATHYAEMRHHAGLIIGLTLASIATIGGLYNPALFLGAMLCNMAELHIPSAENILTFVFAPLIGALLASYFFTYCNHQASYLYGAPSEKM